MLDKRKRSDETCCTSKESSMGANTKQTLEAESEQASDSGTNLVHVAKKLASDPAVQAKVRASLDDSRRRKVLTPKQVLKRLKKRAS